MLRSTPTHLRTLTHRLKPSLTPFTPFTRFFSQKPQLISPDHLNTQVPRPPLHDKPILHRESKSSHHIDTPVTKYGRVLANFGTRLVIQDVSSQEQQPPFVCRLRGRMQRPLVGDVIVWEKAPEYHGPDSEPLIIDILPRTTIFERIDPDGRNMHQLAANVDHVGIVCTVKPMINAILVDRHLAACEKMKLKTSIIFNKIDLTIDPEVNDIIDDYERIGFPVFRISATEGTGMKELSKYLGKSGVSILIGQSGSGKSSILNALHPELNIAINELGKTNQGRHTTTQTVLYHLPNGGEIIDSPGFSNFIPNTVSLKEALYGFPEFKGLSAHCKYGSRCLHLLEPNCAVRSSVIGLNERGQQLHKSTPRGEYNEIIAGAEMDGTMMALEDAKANAKHSDPNESKRARRIAKYSASSLKDPIIPPLDEPTSQFGRFISLRRYDSYVYLIKQLQDMEKNKYN